LCGILSIEEKGHNNGKNQTQISGQGRGDRLARRGREEESVVPYIVILPTPGRRTSISSTSTDCARRPRVSHTICEGRSRHDDVGHAETAYISSIGLRSHLCSYCTVTIDPVLSDCRARKTGVWVQPAVKGIELGPSHRVSASQHTISRNLHVRSFYGARTFFLVWGMEEDDGETVKGHNHTVFTLLLGRNLIANGGNRAWALGR